jgi:hypothetical protein
LIIGPESPGHAFPDALRGAEHNIELQPDGRLNTVAARWRYMRRDDYLTLRQHTDGLEASGILRRLGPHDRAYVNNPILVVNKHDEHGNIVGKRVVHDARALNASRSSTATRFR